LRGNILLMPISDTSPEIQAMQDRMIMSLTGEQLKMALEICEVSRSLAKAGIRSDHPEWSEKQMNREILRLAFFPNALPPGF